MSVKSHEEFLARQPAERSLSEFIEGASAPLYGLGYLNSHPKLWRYAILPTALNLLITCLALVVLIIGAMWLVTELHPWLTEGMEGAWWWLAVAGEILAVVAILLACALIMVLIWKLVGGILCGYFYAKLAEHVELELGMKSDDLRPISLSYEVCDTLLNLTLLIVVNGFILLFNVVPLIGGVLALLGTAYFTWYILGLDYLSFPLALRGVRRRDQFAFGHRHRMHTIGLGSAVFALEFIPIIGAVLLTTATVGAVLLHRRIAMPQTPPSS